jgi:hypothetical protein
MLPENFLHFVWKYGLFSRSNLSTTQHESIEIIHPGTFNTNQGPDFKEAKIKFEDKVFAGHVELHMRNGEWYEHQHHTDPQYANCILHVVYEDTLEQFVLGHQKTVIPILCLQSHITPEIIRHYRLMMDNPAKLPCQHIFILPKPIALEQFKNRLLAERFTRKCQLIKEELVSNQFNWELTFYHSMAASFGLKINRDVFFNIAKSIPLNLLNKYKSDEIKLEALFFGQANLLDESDEYAIVLHKEYQYLKQLHQLTPLPQSPMFLRLRPVSFPTIRLAQFVALIKQSKHLFSELMLIFDTAQIKPFFELDISEYWKKHYHFGKKFRRKISGKLGQSTIEAIAINTIVPFIYLYDQIHHPDSDRFIRFLEQMKPEENAKTSLFSAVFQMTNKTAFDSQAMIEWHDAYCMQKKCLDCVIGFTSLKSIRE